MPEVDVQSFDFLDQHRDCPTGGANLVARISSQPLTPSAKSFDLRLVQTRLNAAHLACQSPKSITAFNAVFHSRGQPASRKWRSGHATLWITDSSTHAHIGGCALRQKFTEPVAFSSTLPTNFRLAPTALGNSFGLLTLRTRCNNQPNETRATVKQPDTDLAAVCGPFLPDCPVRVRLHWQSGRPGSPAAMIRFGSGAVQNHGAVDCQSFARHGQEQTRSRASLCQRPRGYRACS